MERFEWDKIVKEWKIIVRDLMNDIVRFEIVDFVLFVMGCFNVWKLLDYLGCLDFKGLFCYVFNWDLMFDLKGKKVVVIGNGVSGI